jgi:transcriptional regulator with PAS, ATPase and Fis domain
VDCGSLAPGLIETELFGHVKGAFTGADTNRKGLFEAANGGTIFLDEIGELPCSQQVKLLRVLQERTVRPVGGVASVQLNVRIVAATNRNLEAMVAAGTFRQDLYFRLNVVEIRVPPLRERKSDIPVLARAFVEKHQDPPGGVQISEASMSAMEAYDWPGNVRELENAILSALTFCVGRVIHPWDLPFYNLQMAGPQKATRKYCLKAMEEHAINRALKETRGDKLAAAKKLGIAKSTIYRRLKEAS